jgi:hypothetical protein
LSQAPVRTKISSPGTRKCSGPLVAKFALGGRPAARFGCTQCKSKFPMPAAGADFFSHIMLHSVTRSTLPIAMAMGTAGEWKESKGSLCHAKNAFNPETGHALHEYMKGPVRFLYGSVPDTARISNCLRKYRRQQPTQSHEPVHPKCSGPLVAKFALGGPAAARFGCTQCKSKFPMPAAGADFFSYDVTRSMLQHYKHTLPQMLFSLIPGLLCPV